MTEIDDLDLPAELRRPFMRPGDKTAVQLGEDGIVRANERNPETGMLEVRELFRRDDMANASEACTRIFEALGIDETAADEEENVRLNDLIMTHLKRVIGDTGDPNLTIRVLTGALAFYVATKRVEVDQDLLPVTLNALTIGVNSIERQMREGKA